MKKCNKCDLEKDYDLFYKDKTKKDGYMNYCKSCKKIYEDENKEKILQSKKIYYSENKDSIVIKNKIYYSENKNSILETSKKYYSKNKENKIEYQKNYYFLNKEKIQDYKKNNRVKINEKYNFRYKNDEIFRLRKRLSSTICRSLREGGYEKKSRTSKILGCSYEDFKLYIEEMFKDGMTWENHGEWHLDHKTPISWASTEDEIYELNHYTNFQPLWAFDNQSKNNKYADI